MGPPIETHDETGLDDYEPFLRKANLEERKNPILTLKTLKQCMKILRKDYNRFLDRFPKRKTDVIVLERRIAGMERVLKINVDDYSELEKSILNARTHRKQQKLNLLLMDYQEIIFRAEKMGQKETKEQYQQLLAETQTQYDEQMAALKTAIQEADHASEHKEYAVALNAIQRIVEIAPRVGKDPIVPKYQELATRLEKEFAETQKEAAEAEKQKRDAEAAERAKKLAEEKALEEQKRKELEEKERQLQEEMEKKRMEEQAQKEQAEKERIAKEEEALAQQKLELAEASLKEVNSQVKKAQKINMEKITADEIKQLDVQTLQSLSPEQVQDMKDDAFANLSPEQLRSLTKAQIQALTKEQIQNLSPEQLRELSLKQFQYFTPEQITAFQAGQLKQLDPEYWESFTPTQIESLTPAQLKRLESAQLDYLAPEQLQCLSETQLHAIVLILTSDHISHLTPVQYQYILKYLDSEAVKTIPQDQIKVLTTRGDKPRIEWISWTTRIPKDMSDKVLAKGDRLVDEGKIERINRSQLNRYLLQYFASEK